MLNKYLLEFSDAPKFQQLKVFSRSGFKFLDLKPRSFSPYGF